MVYYCFNHIKNGFMDTASLQGHKACRRQGTNVAPSQDRISGLAGNLLGIHAGAWHPGGHVAILAKVNGANWCKWERSKSSQITIVLSAGSLHQANFHGF